MKRIITSYNKKIISVVLLLSTILAPVTVFANTSDTMKFTEFNEAVEELSEEYGIKVEINQNESEQNTISARLSSNTDVSQSYEERLEDIENNLERIQKNLEENNRQAEDEYNNLVGSGRLSEDEESNPLLYRATTSHTVNYYQTITGYYSNKIKCTLKAGVSYYSSNSRYLWTSSVSTNSSSLYSGKATSWTQTKKSAERIDGGKSYYVQVWGTLVEKNGFETYTSVGWRIYYYATCPSSF